MINLKFDLKAYLRDIMVDSITIGRPLKLYVMISPPFNHKIKRVITITNIIMIINNIQLHQRVAKTKFGN